MIDKVLINKIDNSFVLNDQSFLTGPTQLNDKHSKVSFLLTLAKFTINNYHVNLNNNYNEFHKNLLNKKFKLELVKKLTNDIIYNKHNMFYKDYWLKLCTIDMNNKIKL
jgi:hypothetical protein